MTADKLFLPEKKKLFILHLRMVDPLLSPKTLQQKNDRFSCEFLHFYLFEENPSVQHALYLINIARPLSQTRRTISTKTIRLKKKIENLSLHIKK